MFVTSQICEIYIIMFECYHQKIKSIKILIIFPPRGVCLGMRSLQRTTVPIMDHGGRVTY